MISVSKEDKMSLLHRHLSKLSAAIAGSALALCLGLSACASGTSVVSGTESSKVITVSATSEIKAVPDLASITVVITTQGKGPEAAQKANGKPTKAVIAKLKELGVPDKEIQTSYTDLSPVWDEEEEGDTYEMRTSLAVGGLAIDKVHTIMDAVVEAGATEVTGPEYYLSTYTETYREALTAAIESSKPKAEAIAKASGVKLGKVVAVTEGYEDTSYEYATYGLMDEEKAEDTGGTAPLEPGEVSIRADITVSYAIN